MEWEEAADLMIQCGVGGDIPCCASPSARRYLFECAKSSRNVLEIGTFTGVSTLALALSGAMVTTVDLADVNADDAYWSTHEDLEGFPRTRPRELLGNAGVLDRVTFIHSEAPKCLPSLRKDFGFAFIDAWKHEETVYQTILATLDLMAPCGRILLHDIYPEGEVFRDDVCNVPGPWAAWKRISEERPDLICRLVSEVYGEPERMAEIGL